MRVSKTKHKHFLMMEFASFFKMYYPRKEMETCSQCIVCEVHSRATPSLQLLPQVRPSDLKDMEMYVFSGKIFGKQNWCCGIKRTYC
jgi:hypothetical protein